ncbi:MAG: PAS domain S-box protein [Chitinophagaceae bacterium]|nr:PAS domain S-box protein [Chitinophagaceae bacterium]
MENTPSLAWINDEEGNIYYMNSLFKEAFGVPEDINGRNIFEFYPESMRPNCKASDEMVLQTRSSVEVFETGVKPDGKPVYYRVYKFPVESTDGKRLIGGQAIDITGETISKQQLVLEKSQFRSFMDNAPLLAWIVDEQGITRYMNSTFKRSSGFTDENLGKDNHDLYPEVIREKAKISIKEVLAGNQIIRYGYQYTDDNGKPRHFEACKFPIRDQDGNRMVGGQSMEITNLVDAGQQMLDQKNRFESFMENAPQLAWVVDENGTLLYMNSRFKAAFRFSDDMIGLNIREMSSPDKSDRALLENRSVMDRNKAVEYLQDCVDQNGNTHHFRTYKFPMPSNDGKILIGNQSIDITSEVNAKEALNKMHERFEYAGKATRDVIWDWDLQTNRIQRFGGSNAFFDYSSNGDLMDFNNDNIHPDDAEAAERSLQEAIHGDASRWMSEFRYKCAENTYKHVIDQAYIIRDGKGRAIRLIGSMQDVSEERRLQREVLEAEMKKKQDMVTAALIAQERERKEISEELHDNVNQLLASALLFLKIVAREQSSASEYVKQSIEYISNAVSEIRSISHTLNPGILKHNGICAALGEMASGLCIPGKFQVVFNQQLNEPDKLSRELQLALYRIAQEIMNNILKYAEATEVFIQLTDDGQQLELDIDDNGRGFDQSVASKGLGIINIISRAESFGGKVELKSSPGNGCRIKVSIPLPV